MILFQVKKDHSMIESRRLKIAVVFFQTILKFVLSRKIINYLFLSFALRNMSNLIGRSGVHKY